jgi:hypothetical protein
VPCLGPHWPTSQLLQQLLLGFSVFLQRIQALLVFMELRLHLAHMRVGLLQVLKRPASSQAHTAAHFVGKASDIKHGSAVRIK